MLIQAIKQEISNYFRKQNYEVLDLFYKMPCNSCVTVENWEHFEFFPDILLKKNENLTLCFVIFSKNTVSKCKEFIKKNYKFNTYKIFLYENHSFYEEINDKFSLILKEISPSLEKFNSSSKTYKSINDKFAETRLMGKLGEDKLTDYFKKTNKDYFNLNFNAPCDTCSEPENWKKFNKLPDGIFLEGKKIFFF